MPHSVRDDINDERCMLEPIAICGMACRLPGGIDSASSFWDMLVDCRDGQTPKVPESRFNIDAYYHKNLERPGSFNVMGGYFLDGNPADFDPTAFGITPIEAQWLDPQQRKIIEVVYECFESAGLPLDRVAGSNTAVFVGSFTSDYQQMSIRDPDFRHNYAATGVDPGIISNRVGNLFNLNGPSFTINTACSSSVYALHNACHALRARDCDAAVVGGVNLIITVDQHMNTAKLGILSPTSFCHTFDASADGYGRAEGAGALYIKRLSDAIRDNDVVRAVIRSTAVNTNGKVDGMGITHPSVLGQEKVVRLAYERANLDPTKTAYAELHGTGTPVGDPIEVRAVSSALNDKRSKDKPLLLGAVKPNIGHSEAASGIFAVMKAAMMTETGLVPGIARFNTLNPNIHEEDWNVKVNRKLSQWPEGFSTKRASVSSFGYGGTNGHVIVESVETLHPWYQHGAQKQLATYDHSCARAHLICLSAHDKTTLQRNIDALRNVADKYYVSDLAYTLNVRRTKHSQRAYFIAKEDSMQAAFADAAIKYGVAPKQASDVSFMFTGQGAQYLGMARSALREFSTMRRVVRQLDDVLRKLNPPPSFSLEALLADGKGEEGLNDASMAQPATTAIQIAIVDLLSEWDIFPTVCVGHSSGEIGAAYAAGLLSAPEAIIAAFCRGRAVNQESTPGTMLSVGLGVEDVAQYLIGKEDKVFIACENSPSSVTLSGSVDDCHEVQKMLDAKGVFARELSTGRAYHSPYMHAVGDKYDEMLSSALRSLDDDDFAWRTQGCPMVSSVTGEIITESKTVATSAYWSANLRNRVRFTAAITQLVTDPRFNNVRSIIEIGPRPALSGPVKQICLAEKADKITYVPSLVRNADDLSQMLSVAGALFTAGYPVDLEAVNARSSSTSGYGTPIKEIPHSVLVDLPPYQWNYSKQFWAEPRTSAAIRTMNQPRHDLLGRRLPGMSHHASVWKNFLRHRDLPWLKDHSLGGAAMFPAAGHMALAIEALRQLNEAQGLSFEAVTLKDVTLHTALIVPNTDDGIEIQVTLTQEPNDGERTWFTFAVESRDGATWTLNSGGRLSVNSNKADSTSVPASVVAKDKLTQRVPARRWYEAFHRVGFQYDPHFQQLKVVNTNQDLRQAAARVNIQQHTDGFDDESRYIIHPSTVDACLQLIIISIHQGQHKTMPWGVVPIKIDHVDFWFPKEMGEGSAVAWTSNVDGRYFGTHTKLYGTDGAMVMDIKNLRCVSYEAALPPSSGPSRPPQPYAETIWKQDILSFTSEDAAIAWPRTFSATEAIARIIDLLDHWRPVTSMLVLGRPERSTISTMLGVLSTSCQITIAYKLEEEAKLLEELAEAHSNIALASVQDATTATYNLVVADASFQTAEALPSLVASDGWLLHLQDNAREPSPLEAANLTEVLDVGIPFSYYGRPGQSMKLYKESAVVTAGQLLAAEVTLLQDGSSQLAQALEDADVKVAIKPLPAFDAEKDRTVIIDAMDSLNLRTMTEQQYDAIKRILSSSALIVFVTKGVNQGQCIDSGMAAGFLRVVRSEQAASKIVLIDSNVNEPASAIAVAISRKLNSIPVKDSRKDTEYWLRDGVFHVARVLPNNDVNRTAAGQQTFSKAMLQHKVEYETTHTDDGLVYVPAQIPASSPDENEVSIQVEAFSRSSAGLPVLLYGTVLSRGMSVAPNAIGRKVVAFSTSGDQTITKSSTFAVLDTVTNADDLLANLPAILVVVYASLTIGHIQRSDKVTIVPGQSELQAALVGLATALKWSFTVKDKQSNIDDQASIVLATDFDAAAQHAWQSISRQGKFILCSPTAGIGPDLSPFKRGASFLSANVQDALEAGGTEALDVLNLALNLYRAHRGMIFRAPVLKCSASALGTTKQTVSVVQHEYGPAKVNIRSPSSKPLAFDPEASYLLVGCLGGLGRSLTGMMQQRGAKHFAFLSRSGADKPDAAAVVDNLKQNGCEVKIFRGDAANDQDVQKAVAEIESERKVKGVVHAAMVLKDGIYSNMSFKDWQTCVNPKVAGALALHNALKGRDLDFFVMTSSISATLGNPGQANYAAANSFLDSLAWHRTLNGQAATSLILPMVLDVGVVAETDDLEVSLLRKGMYGISEDEMLQGFSTAMAPPKRRLEANSINAGCSQLILGLDASALARSIQSSDIANAYWYNDARFGHLRQAVEDAVGSGSSSGSSSGGSFEATIKAAQTEGTKSVLEAIATHIATKVGSILMLPTEDFDLNGPSIGDYGLDSMIGAELRSWLYKQFTLDIAFQTLLASSFLALSKIIALQHGYAKEEDL